MKTTLITTFAIAVMVFAFNATPSHAGDSDGKAVYECTGWTHQGTVYGEGRDCKRVSELDELKSPEQQTAAAESPEKFFGESDIDELEDLNEIKVAIDSTSPDDDWKRWIEEQPWYKRFAVHAEDEKQFKSDLIQVAQSERTGTAEEIRKWDENRWNQWILDQMFGQAGSLTEYAYAGEEAFQQFAFIGEAFCVENPDSPICSDFSNQDQDEIAGQREFANSGEEGSFSAAGVTLGGSPTDVVEGGTEEVEEPLNNRTLRTGNY